MRISLIIFLLWLCNLCIAQPYIFSITQENFTFLDSTKSTRLSSDTTFYLKENFTINIGFNFKIGNESFDSVKLNTDGLFTFFQKCSSNQTNEGPILFSMFLDYVDRGHLTPGSPILSKVHYLIDSTDLTNKILKVEYFNMGLHDGEVYDDFINYQVWLYENSNILEIKMGLNYITDPYDIWGYNLDGPLSILMYEINCNPPDNPVSLLLFGDPNAPSDTIVHGQIVQLPQYYFNTIPSEGTVYRFIPNPIGVDEKEVNNVKVEPTLVKDAVTIINSFYNEDLNISIYNISGMRIFEGIMKDYHYYINMEGESSGIYFLTVSGKNLHKSFKIIKL